MVSFRFAACAGLKVSFQAIGRTTFICAFHFFRAFSDWGNSLPWSRSAARAAVENLCLSGPNRVLADYWLSLWRGDSAPGRGAFDPARVRELLPGIAIFEVRPGESIHCRLAGAAYKFRFGFEMAGIDWMGATPSSQRAVRMERNSQIVAGAISAGTRSDPDRDEAERWFSDVQLPFAGVGEDGARTYLHHSDWRPKADEHRLKRVRSGGPAVADTFRAIPIADSQPRAEPGKGLVTSLLTFDGEVVFLSAADSGILEPVMLQLAAAGLSVTTGWGGELAGRGPPSVACIVANGSDEDRWQEEIVRLSLEVPVIALTPAGNVRAAVRAIAAGAIDVLEFPFRLDQLLGSIANALESGGDARKAVSGARARTRIAVLTAREKQVFELLVAGRRSHDIACALGISKRTVDVHRATILRKLAIDGIAGLVRLALDAG